MNNPPITPNQILQGRAPGVVVKQKSGAPGGVFEVRVRGIGSLGAGSNPLYVVDGFVVGTSVGQNLNPNDIENVTVLKDAASTAIYGARGSNGGCAHHYPAGQRRQSSCQYVARLWRAERTDIASGENAERSEFAQFKKDIFMDQIRILQGREPLESEVPIGYRFPAQTQYSTDWYDLIMNKNAPYSDLNLAVSSGAGADQSDVVGWVLQVKRYHQENRLRPHIRSLQSGWADQ